MKKLIYLIKHWIYGYCKKCGSPNVKIENGKQVFCSWCDTDW